MPCPRRPLSRFLAPPRRANFFSQPGVSALAPASWTATVPRRSSPGGPFRAHLTRMVPRFFTPYRETIFFLFPAVSPNHFRGLSFGIALSFVRLSFSSCLCGLRGRPFRSLPPSAQTHVHNSPRRADSVHRVHRVHRVHHPSLLSWNARSSYARSTLNPQLSTHFPS